MHSYGQQRWPDFEKGMGQMLDWAAGIKDKQGKRAYFYAALTDLRRWVFIKCHFVPNHIFISRTSTRKIGISVISHQWPSRSSARYLKKSRY